MPTVMITSLPMIDLQHPDRMQPMRFLPALLGIGLLFCGHPLAAGTPNADSPPTSSTTTSASTNGAPAVDVEPDSIERDYADELPSSEPVPPSAALESFEIVPGFRIELAAHEPLVTDPVAAAFDEWGRLYVVQMSGYSEDGDDHLGSVVVLQDIDRDGRFESSQTVVSGLSWPTAIACWDGGIVVGHAPHVTYFKDLDGDLKPDQSQVILTGFQRNNVQGMLNSFCWGPDNRLYLTSSSTGGRDRSTVASG